MAKVMFNYKWLLSNMCFHVSFDFGCLTQKTLKTFLVSMDAHNYVV